MGKTEMATFAGVFLCMASYFDSIKGVKVVSVTQEAVFPTRHMKRCVGESGH